MAFSNLRLRMEMDNTSVIRAVDQAHKKVTTFEDSVGKLGNKFGNLGQIIGNELGNKLTAALSVTGIEEMVRRTGEWATHLARSAKELGIGVEEMQALILAADRANISQEKIFTLYDKINAKAIEAYNGNIKLAQSFNKLGIETSKLKNMATGDILSRIMKPGADPQALLNVTGERNLLSVNSLGKEFNGRSIDQYTKQSKESNLITPAGDINGIASTWIQFTQDLKSLGNKFIKIPEFLINIVDGITKMLLGIVGTIEYIPKYISNILKHPFTKSSYVNDEAGARLIGGINGLSLGLAPKIRGSDAAGAGVEREAEGFGEAVTTAATFGYGPAARALGYGAKGVATAAGFVGAEKLAVGAGSLGEGLGRAGVGTIAREGVATPIIQKSILKIFEKLSGSEFSEASSSKLIKGFSEKSGIPEDIIRSDRMGPEGKKALSDYVDNYISNSKSFKTAAFVANKAGLAGELGIAGRVGSGDSHNFDKSLEEKTDRTSQFGAMNKIGGGSGNLSIGGVFGVDLQAKIYRLNDEQLSQTKAIVKNTLDIYNWLSNVNGDRKNAPGIMSVPN